MKAAFKGELIQLEIIRSIFIAIFAIMNSMNGMKHEKG